VRQRGFDWSAAATARSQTPAADTNETLHVTNTWTCFTNT